jgi:thiamine biosynthesis lipoprotein
MADTFTRRRAICIMAAAAGLPLVASAGPAFAAAVPVVWKGQALGAPATLILNHPDRAKAEVLVRRVVAEVERLESILSLYRDTSALCELNRVGALAMPPQDLVSVLDASRTVFDITGGAFDPSVQPLFALYARHFARPDAAASGPSVADLEQAKALVDFGAARFNPDRIAFARRGMALTLNGIAQGYVTDRVVALLRDEGIDSSLVDMGEGRAIGAQADGSPWRIGIAETQADRAGETVIPLIDKAIATSAFSGFRFDPAGRFSHILDPRQGSVPPRYRRLTVIAADATTADGYSTAFSLIDLEHMRSILARQPQVTVDLVTSAGEHLRLGRAIGTMAL